MENFKLELEGKIDSPQMLAEATVAALKQELKQVKAKRLNCQMLEATVAALKQELKQVKAKRLN
jgi:hypothetical protein